MKKVYLIGDSIRFGSVGGAGSPGYQRYVQEKTLGNYEVDGPKENCRFAQYTLRGLCDWVNGLDADAVDVVHWNNGLWDVLRLNGDDPLTPIDMYVSMLRRIHQKLRLFFPNAKIIFATSTPVVETRTPKDWRRYNHEIEAYNEAAVSLMAELGVMVNDLYTTAKRFDETYYVDAVHFSEEGARILADQIIMTIESVCK